MFKYIFLIGTLVIGVLQCQPKEKDMHSNKDRQPNHLIDESSPYLLQHAYNPVDWYPWGEEALQKAREEDKLLIISIGYSACHWCHVMEKESFEDSLVAATMNTHFVSVKVDREERPDIDDIYMTACQLAGETSCGWPLNAFAMPDGRPIWAGTYFPKKNWIQILEYFQKLKTDEREKLEKYASQLTEGIQLQENALVNMEPETPDFSDDQVIQIANTFLAGMDKRMGGSAGAPKFPMPVNYGFLLRFAELYDHEKAREATFLTLDKMADGGIYDHLGGGFARYSTDARWHIPHFEKMLYDNGQLLSIYSHGYQLAQDEQYLRVIDETIAFLTRELRDPGGGFYSSLDADSEGEEGKFYVWSSDEIDTLLTDETQRNLFRDRYDVKNQGNWEDGKNVLQIVSSIGDLAKKYRIEESHVRELLASAKDILFKARESRVRPGLDDKMLCAWNGLVLTGLADAYKATENEKYLDLALECGTFIRKAYLQDNHRLLRNHKAGKSSINGFLDDYAFAIRAFIALYEITFDEEWLEDAHAMTDYAIGHFLDDSSGYFFYTSDLDPPLVTRKKELSDNVIPASNSAMARNLHLLGLYYYDQQYLEMASSMLRRIVPQILESGQPGFYANWCDMLLSHLNPFFEVAVVGPESEKLSHKMMHHYQPRAIFLGGENEGTLELLKDKLIEGETLIYVCKDKVCKLPVKTAAEAMTLMQ